MDASYSCKRLAQEGEMAKAKTSYPFTAKAIQIPASFLPPQKPRDDEEWP